MTSEVKLSSAKFLGNYFLYSYRKQKFRAEETLVSLYRNKSFLSGKQRF